MDWNLNCTIISHSKLEVYPLTVRVKVNLSVFNYVSHRESTWLVWRHNATDSYLTLTTDEAELSASGPCHFTPGIRDPDNQHIGDQVKRRARSSLHTWRIKKSLAWSTSL
jgi:hypothetical protein